MCQDLRVLNAIRDYQIGIPLTFTQYPPGMGAGGPWGAGGLVTGAVAAGPSWGSGMEQDGEEKAAVPGLMLVVPL